MTKIQSSSYRQRSKDAHHSLVHHDIQGLVEAEVPVTDEPTGLLRQHFVITAAV